MFNVRLSVINVQLSMFDYQLSIISYQLSMFDYQCSIMNFIDYFLEHNSVNTPCVDFG